MPDILEEYTIQVTAACSVPSFKNTVTAIPDSGWSLKGRMNFIGPGVFSERVHKGEVSPVIIFILNRY